MLLLEAAFITAVLLLSGIPFVESGLVFEGRSLFQERKSRPCSIECRVRSTSLLQYPPLVEWYRDKAFTPTNESISEYVSVLSPYWQSRHYYPRATCVQQPGNVPRYNCDLTFQYCHMGYFGRYRCDVTSKETGKTISRSLRLRAISPDPGPKPRCYMPRAVNLTVVPHYLENGSLTATLYWNYTQKPDRQEYCDGSRQWTVGYKTYDNVWGTPSDFGRVSWLTVSMETADTHFEFTGISKSMYYIFQVHNEANNAMGRRPQDFTSGVYYFGEQVPPQVITQHRTIRLTVGQNYTIRCTAVGTPRPTVHILQDRSNFHYRYHDEDDDTVSTELVLHNVQKNNSGLYYCHAYNILVNPPSGKRQVSDIVGITVTVEDGDDFSVSGDSAQEIAPIASDESNALLTSVGVPDAPRIELDGDTLTWDAPNDRGSPITGYRITATIDSVPSAETFSDDRVMTINLRTTPNFLNISGVTYSIQVFAENDIGEGPGSEPVSYTYTNTTSSPSTISTEAFIATVAAIIGFVVLLIICTLAFVWCMVMRLRHKALDIRSNNDNYGDRIQDHAQGTHNLYTKDVPKELMISSTSLRLLHSVGEGEFGIVYKAHFVKSLQLHVMPDIVAVKTLKGFFDQNGVADMIKESVKMYGIKHPHVLNIIGVCVDAGPAPYIVMPFMANGSLLAYIRKEKLKFVVSVDNEDNEQTVTALKRLADICLQIAKAMEYLASKNIVHRDLATWNCMIDTNFIIKVADFGLSESMYSKTYFRQEKDRAVKLPVKWLAPEALNEGVFSEKSDVWAYGVTCWEIFTGGRNPYPGVDPVSLPNLLESGHRLDKPNNAACSEEIYLFMFKCWHADPNERPTFSELVSLMSQTLGSMAGYMDVLTFGGLELHTGKESDGSTEVEDEL